jgi:heat shock protein HtpX
MALGMLGMMVTGSFSRKREYRADHGAARLVGNDKMIRALEKLKNVYPPKEVRERAEQRSKSVAALRISGSFKKSSLAQLMSTHPPLDQRISALKGRSL